MLWQLASTLNFFESLKGTSMPKEEWGIKRVCPTTGKRFYDLNKNPIISPYTGEAVVFDNASKARTMVADKPDAETTAKEVDTEEEVVLDDAEDIEDVEFEDDVLDDDDDDTVPLEEIADVAADDDDN
jgi:uncharacterized protein (TIGR02300 family)